MDAATYSDVVKRPRRATDSCDFRCDDRKSLYDVIELTMFRLEFRGKVNYVETRVGPMGLLSGESCMILHLTVFD